MGKLQQLAFELEEELNKAVESRVPDYSAIARPLIEENVISSSSANDPKVIVQGIDYLIRHGKTLDHTVKRQLSQIQRLKDELYGSGDWDAPEEAQQVEVAQVNPAAQLGEIPPTAVFNAPEFTNQIVQMQNQMNDWATLNTTAPFWDNGTTTNEN